MVLISVVLVWVGCVCVCVCVRVWVDKHAWYLSALYTRAYQRCTCLGWLCVYNFQKKINQKSTETCGELDHPDSQIINLKNASHAIRSLRWEGDEIIGTVEIFCDPGDKGTNSGRIAGALVRNGLMIGISSRGMGSLKQVGEIMEVQDDFELLTWDLVSNPSNPDSWMLNSSLNEGKSSPFNPYQKVDSIVTEILCANGTCPIF